MSIDRGTSDISGRQQTLVTDRLFAPMNATLDDICADYGDAQLETITELVRRTADAWRTIGHDLTMS